MARSLPLLALWGVLVLPAQAVGAPAGVWELRETVVAEVGGVAITLREARLQASLTRGRLVDAGEADVLSQAVAQLVDQEIVWREMMERGRVGQGARVDTDAMARAIETTAGGADRLTVIRRVLAVTAAEWEGLLQRQALVAGFVAHEFQPFVYISPEEVRRFYIDEWQAAAHEEDELPGLEAVAPDIEVLLRQRKISAELESWLARRRLELRVRHLPLPDRRR